MTGDERPQSGETEQGKRAHAPVLIREVTEFLNVRPNGFYIDATLGAGGHAEAIAGRLGSGRLLALDRDPLALATARGVMAPFGDKVTLMRGNFAEIDTLHANTGFPPVDGVVADLGLSSMQLADSGRGFSFNIEGPLDMRMDPESETSAADLVNYTSERELADLIFKFGEERLSRRIARALMKARPIRTSTELAQVVTRAIPSRPGLHQIHPATRTFMALRLAVNRELDNLEEFLARVLTVVAVGGRVVVISFHSLEDRMVKQAFAAWGRDGRARVLTRKVVRAGEDEVGRNPRARSAKLRAAEKADRNNLGDGSEAEG
ncbi:MAG TPA: 16S rRNA (cytosine(1402)-N(4))-methyltransferase RsmH [Terriglobia bacterium]|nr:16S rRNA (cytosine(1402)-N(4))-methyltransferase RsmH [Terriglobia bacterium]